MICARCGYKMEPFDRECLACAQQASPPAAAVAQEPTIELTAPVPPPDNDRTVQSMLPSDNDRTVQMTAPGAGPVFPPQISPPASPHKPMARTWLAIRLAVICTLGLMGLAFVLRVASIVQSVVPEAPEEAEAPVRSEPARPIVHPPPTVSPVAPAAPNRLPSEVLAPQQPPPAATTLRPTVELLQAAYANHDTAVLSQYDGRTVVVSGIFVGSSAAEDIPDAPRILYLAGNDQLFPRFECVLLANADVHMEELRAGYGVIIRGRVEFTQSSGPRLVDCDYVSGQGVEPGP